MKAPGKLTLILMHDDGKAHRLRVGRKLFTLLLTLLMLLPTLGGFGIWVGMEAWGVWSALEQERARLQRGMAEWRLRAERLDNVLRLAGIEHDVPGPVPAVAAAEFAALPDFEALAASVEPAASAEPIEPVDTAQANATLPAATLAPAALSAANATVPAVEFANGTPDEAALDTGAVRLENLTARVQDNNKLRIVLDLYNAKPNGGTIGGRFIIRLIDPTGKPLPLQHDEGTFRITRYKKVIMQAGLPAEVTAADNAALLVTVLVDEEPVLRKIFSVESR